MERGEVGSIWMQLNMQQKEKKKTYIEYLREKYFFVEKNEFFDCKLNG